MRSPSISYVAKLAGVSTATVSRIVNGVTNRSSPETLARVQQIIEETGYRPSSAGQSLRRRESRMIAVIAANLSNPSMASMAASIEVAMRNLGLVMVLCDSHEQPDLQDEYLLEMRAQAVRSCILLGAVKSPVLEQMLEASEPLVFVNRRNPYNPNSAFVGIDNRKAAIEVGTMVETRGTGSLLLLHGPLHSSATAERMEAFDRFFKDRPNIQVTTYGSDSLDHLNIGYKLTNTYLQKHIQPPSAIIGLSDLITYGAARALREAGKNNTDTVLVGFDGNPINEWVAPWLNSIRIPYEDFGPVVAQAMSRVWNGEKHFSASLPYQLIEQHVT